MAAAGSGPQPSTPNAFSSEVESQLDEKAGYNPKNWAMEMSSLAGSRRLTAIAHFPKALPPDITTKDLRIEWLKFISEEKKFALDTGHSYTEYWVDEKHSVTKLKFCQKINFLDDALKLMEFSGQSIDDAKASLWCHVVRVTFTGTGKTFGFVVTRKRSAE